MRRLFPTLIAMIALTLLAVPAGASMQYYTSQTEWIAATSDVFTIDFNGYGQGYAPYYVDYSTGGGITLGGVNFVGFTGITDEYRLEVDNPGRDSGDWGSGDYLRGGWAPSYVLVTLPGSGSTAVGFNLMSYPNAKVVLVTFSTGDSRSVSTFTRPTQAFLGAISDTPITSVSFSTSGGYTLLDNFQYEETPEADTVLLGGLGLAALVFARRLRLSC